MSQENVEIVRGVYDAIARREPAAVLAAYDRNVEWDFSGSPLAIVMGSGVYRGHEGIRSWVRDRYEAWESIEDQCEELIDAGEHVVAVVNSWGRGRASGVEVELTHAAVWTIGEGKIVRVEWFGTREQALEAAGLSEA